MPIKRKSRTLSQVGCEMFEPINMFSPSNKLNKMNSWSENTPPASPSNKNRRKSTGCLGYKNFNLKQVFLDLITSDFDMKLIENSLTMRKAAKKLISYLYNKEKSIPYYTNNAVTNLVVLILSDGEKYLTKQKVKHNIHFYLRLAEKAMKEKDHQTAILIKTALLNHNITRLKIPLNKGDQKIATELHYNYGGFRDCHGKHVRHFLDKYEILNKDWEEKGIDEEWIPSAMVLHMHTNKNKTYTKAYARIGKYPKQLIDMNDKLKKLEKEYYKAFFLKKEAKLTKIYDTNPQDLDIVKQINKDNKETNITQTLFHLSCNVKKVKSNDKKQINKEKWKSNTLKWCN
jgi:hypothetical protein|tara:strand:- start:7579 stop:8610 length:1032 start_codon:yes stop_codon:yes gene_type:complete